MIRSLKHSKRLNAAGDTIIEVLIVLAILGLSLAVSYATANRGLQQSRNAQEHSAALGLLDSQVELVRTAFANHAEASLPAAPFCLAPPTGAQLVNPTTLGPSFNDTLANDTLNTATYPGVCTQSSLYNISIVGRGSGVFDFRVRWFGIGDLGRQQEELTYKIGTIAATYSGGYINPQVPPPPPFSGALKIIVKAIPATGPSGTTTNPTPPCSNPSTNLSGTAVKLNGTGGPFGPNYTDVNSTAIFNNLQQGDTYTAVISRPNWQVCSGGGSGVASATAPVPSIPTATIRPICSASPPLGYVNNYYDYYRDAGLDGYWKFGNSTPDSAYTSSYYDAGGGLHTSPYPWYWYFVGSPTYQWINGSLYRYYWVYDAYYHNEAIYGCPS